MYRKLLTVWIALAFVLIVASPINTQMLLTVDDTVHVEVYSWTGDATIQTPPESVFVIVYNPIGDSIWDNGVGVDTTDASLKGPYLRRRGNGGTVNVYNWWQPVSVIDGDDGEGLYHISIWIGGAEDTGWATDVYFQLVDNPINDIVPAMDTLSWWLTAGLNASSATNYAADRDTIFVVSPGNDTLGILIYFHIGGNSGGRPDSVVAEAAP